METPAGWRLQRGLSLSRCRQNHGADRQGIRRGDGKFPEDPRKGAAMKRLKTRVVNILIVLWLVIGTAGRLSAASVLTTPAQAADKPREMNIGGYLSVGHSQAPASFNAGYPIYRSEEHTSELQSLM